MKNIKLNRHDLQREDSVDMVFDKYQFDMSTFKFDREEANATALENNCTIIYSEDMQHNQLFENKLKIINPFI